MNIEVKYHNSAGRMLAALQALPARQTYSIALPGLYGATGDDEGSNVAYQCLHELNGMLDKLILDMNHYPVESQKGIMLNGFKGVNDFLCPVNLQTRMPGLDSGLLATLEMAATGLPQENEPSPEDLERIRASIETLRGTVEDADTHPILRKILLEFIRRSRDAVDKYNIHGGDGLDAAFKGMMGEVGAMLVSTSLVEQDEIKSTPAWLKVCQHIGLFHLVVSTVLNYPTMIEDSWDSMGRLLGVDAEIVAPTPEAQKPVLEAEPVESTN